MTSGHWEVFSYADVETVATDLSHFSRDYLRGVPRLRWHPALDAIWASDPPRHSHLRELVAEPFGPSALRPIEPDIRAIAADLLAGILAKGGSMTDLMTFARTFSYRVICRILDLPLDDDVRIAQWVKEQITAPSVFELPAQTGMIRYFRDVIRQRTRDPGGGIIDRLIGAKIDGRRVAGRVVSDRTLLGYIWTLVVAGSETTATTIGNVLVACIEGGHIERLRLMVGKNRRGLDLAIAEGLRWNPAFPATTVIAAEDIPIGGCVVPQGAPIRAWLSAANRDPGRFSRPDVFDIEREPNRHLSFGVGPHFCLGAPLAMLETRVALETFLGMVQGPLRLDRDSVVYHLGIDNSLRSAVVGIGR